MIDLDARVFLNVGGRHGGCEMTSHLADFLGDTARKRRILALDGGGVRGMFTLGVLRQLEDVLRRRFKDDGYRLCNYFDLIGGTSTGSIIATGLALGMSVAEIAAHYKRMCPDIFKSPAPDAWAAVAHARFKSGPLTKALGDAFGDNTLSSQHLKTGLAIHCMRLDRGSAWILVNNPAWKYYYDTADSGDGAEGAGNRKFRLRDLVQASTAAPFYFRGRTLTVATDPTGKKSEEDGFFVDGGVSGNNNPALEMLMAVRDPAFGFNWALGEDQLLLMSIGTGSIRGHLTAKAVQQKQSWEHAKDSLSAMIGAVSQQQVALLQAMSRSERRWIINAEKGAQPTAPYLTPAPMFDYQRLDVRLDVVPALDERADEHANAFLRQPLTKAQAAALARIDCVEDANLRLLESLGESVGRRHIGAGNPRPVFDEGLR